MWLKEQGCPFDPLECREAAKGFHQQNILDWLVSIGYDDDDNTPQSKHFHLNQQPRRMDDETLHPSLRHLQIQLFHFLQSC
jgi:hypothetical protein